MSDDTKHRFPQRHPAVWLLAIMIVTTCMSIGHAQSPIIEKHQGVIVLDPGHGGRDTGAKGPDGTFEKTVTMNLARMTAAELGSRYKVILTRTDDYVMDIPSRTAVANHASADLFISIHSGGSFLHQVGGISVYYFKEPSGIALTPETEISSLKGSDSRIPWDNLQERHKTTSRVLSELIRKRINEQAIFINSRIQGAPLMVLAGADLPAIVVEIGYITNPAEEKALLDINTLSQIAKGIRNGIENYFEKVH
ncbi:MAG: N-acetylmuramoyl-L-alanine amidase [Proteobacteria bacterium]|nr:N-acetylmuramoyl-L-alanine amidase [Pseudomonadota bacterium]